MSTCILFFTTSNYHAHSKRRTIRILTSMWQIDISFHNRMCVQNKYRTTLLRGNLAWRRSALSECFSSWKYLYAVYE